MCAAIAVAAVLGFVPGIPALFGSLAAAAATAGPEAAYQPPGTPDPSVAGATTPFTTY